MSGDNFLNVLKALIAYLLALTVAVVMLLIIIYLVCLNCFPDHTTTIMTVASVIVGFLAGVAFHGLYENEVF